MGSCQVPEAGDFPTALMSGIMHLSVFATNPTESQFQPDIRLSTWQNTETCMWELAEGQTVSPLLSETNPVIQIIETDLKPAICFKGISCSHSMSVRDKWMIEWMNRLLLWPCVRTGITENLGIIHGFFSHTIGGSMYNNATIPILCNWIGCNHPYIKAESPLASVLKDRANATS